MSERRQHDYHRAAKRSFTGQHVRASLRRLIDQQKPWTSWTAPRPTEAPAGDPVAAGEGSKPTEKGAP